ncbi:MAG: serine hydrolase [candidate division Zixibacteria bacterium]|nr:serine hydrolase [candidate division Zixibacteria bacterium]
MTQTRNFLTVLLLCACLLAACGILGRDKEVVKGELGTRLDEYLTKITPFGFSGACLVAKDGKIILNKGYGMAVRSEGVKNTSQTVFSVGSITKQFTAAGIMKLEMEGKLNTHDLLSTYLEGVPTDKASISLHDLLTHTSGLIQDVGKDYDVAERDETVKKILEQPLESHPGERFEYTNVGYTLLAAVIEKLSGQPYEEFLNQNLFNPAGMHFTGYRLPQWNERVVAHWYVGGTDNGTPLEKPYPYWNLIGNGGILSTTEDMYKWHLALTGDKILSTDAKEKLYTTYLNDYAYGWDVLDTPHGILIQHNGGSVLGNSAEFIRYVDADVVIVLLCNESYGTEPLSEVVRHKIEALVFGGELKAPPSVRKADPANLARFVGEYKLPSGGFLKVSVEGGRLTITAEGQDALNPLVFPEHADPNFCQNLNRLSQEIFQAAIQGDYGPFGEVLANKEGRLDRVREFINTRTMAYQDRTGVIQKAKALGTLPSSYEEGAVETIVELKGQKGSIFFSSIWLDDKNIGVAPVRSAKTIAIPFLPVSKSEFAGYHLGMAQDVRVSFQTGDAGLVAGLTIHCTGTNIKARKLAGDI